MKRDKTGFFLYADHLVELFQGMTTTLISGSPLEALNHVQKRFRFKEVYASRGEKVDATFTGRYKELATDVAKRALLDQWPHQQHRHQRTSFAFGDSQSDEPTFEFVPPENAFILVERKKQAEKAVWLQRCTNRGWRIIYDDEDVVKIVAQRLREVMRV